MSAGINNCMATRRRDAFPGKDKATPSPQTGTAKLRGAVNQISKPSKVTTAPQKQTRPASRTPTTDVPKLQTRKPASSTTASKPTQTRTRSLDNKAVNPTQKTRISATITAAAPRSSSLPVKAVAAPKPAPVKKWKPVATEEGKRRLSGIEEGKRRLSTASVGNGRRSSAGIKKESRNSASGTKEQITSFNLDKVDDLSMYSVPEPEMRLQDIEYSYLAEAEEKTVQMSDFEKGIGDLAREQYQEALNFAKIEDVINHSDPTVVIAESFSVSEQQKAPVSNDVIEETASKLRELRKNKVRALAGAFETVISLQEK